MTEPRSFLRVTLAALLCASLGACVTTDKAGAPDKAVAADPVMLEQPRFTVGDYYRFDQPDAVWRVAAIEDQDLVRWELEAGRGQLTYQHPFFPPLEWWSEGTGNGRRLISDVKGDLFPIAVGKRMTFKATVSADTPPHAWEYDWSCESLREEEVRTAIGRFNTIVVQCGRVQPDEYMFWYAPTTGFYVRYRVTRFGQPPLTRDLIGFRNAVLASRGEALAKLQVPGPDGMALEAPPATARTPEVARVDVQPVAEPTGPTALTPSSVATPAVVTQPQMPPPATNPAPADSARSPAVQQPAPAATASRAVPEATTPKTAAASTPAPASPARPATPARTPPKVTETPAAPAQAVADVPAGASTKAAPSAVTATATATAQSAGLHLASYKDRENAERGWKQLLSRNEDVLKGLTHTVEPVDLGDRGTFYRLVAGPVSDRDQAQRMCGTLKTRGAYCQLVN